MQQLQDLDGLAVCQKKEWTEILVGWETKNRYAVMDTSGRDLYMAGEESGALSRLFLKTIRPWTIRLVTPDGQTAMTVKRPFRFYFHEAEVADASGQVLGTIKRQFSVVRRIYSVVDTSGREVFQLFGPLLHPWTFNVLVDGQEIGRIVKKWSGLGKEMFTDADNFGASFPVDLDVRAKALLLGAVFLIDFVHFETSGGNN